jgi:hypothetical protein
MAGMYAEALPEFGLVRIVLDVRDWASMPTEGQLFRSLVPHSDPDWYDSAVKVRVRPTYVIGDEYPQYGYPFEMLSGGVDVWYDAEAPLDVPVYYTAELVGGDAPYVSAVAAVNMIENGDFETGIAGWQADAGAALFTTAQPLFGVGSLRVNVVGTPVFTGARPTVRYVVDPTHRYEFSGWARVSSSTGEARIAIDWWTTGGAYLSTTYTPQFTIPADVTTRRSVAASPPPTGTRAEPRIVWSANPPNNANFRADRLRMFDMGTGSTSSPVTLASNDGGWLSNPQAPAVDVRLDLLPTDDCVIAPDPTGVMFLSHEADTRAGAGSRFDVVDQAMPAVIVARRKAPTSTLTIASLSFADRDAVHELLADGAVLLVRVPPEFGVQDRYMDVGDVKTGPLSPDLRLPYRVIDLPYAQAGSPGAPTDGVLGNRFADLDRYATWSAFDAAALTSIDLLLGAGSTFGVGA